MMINEDKISENVGFYVFNIFENFIQISTCDNSNFIVAQNHANFESKSSVSLFYLYLFLNLYTDLLRPNSN